MTIKETIQNWMQGVENDIIKQYLVSGRKASGDFEHSLEQYYEEKNGVIKTGILGAHYAYWMENGRKPTRQGAKPGNPTLKQVIRQWIDDKAIKPRGDISKDSLAYLIARKIHREGYKGKPLVSKVVTPERIAELQKQLGKQFETELKKQLWQ